MCTSRLTRFVLPLVLSVVAAAGCGSGKATHPAALSPSAYHTRVNAAIAPWDIAVHGLTAGVTTSTLRKVASTARQAARAVSAVRPPPSVAGLQSQLVTTLDRNAVHAEQWARALRTQDRGAASRLAAEFRQDGRTILKLDNEYKAKGVTL